MERPHVEALVAMAHVADVRAAADFYAKLGFEAIGSFTPPGEEALAWVSLRSGNAQLMLTLASEPVLPAQQGVLFYVYCADVAAMRASLAEAGLEPGEITKPFFNPEGEFRLVDPDGYVVLVTHL
jgi:predicted enzyme related to lactoylglutathione lyase